MKANELTGAALDRAVAKCEGSPSWMMGFSTEWGKGGPIIEREKIGLWSEGYDWEAKIQIGSGEWITEWADTPLIAAMRCYVASKLGEVK